MDRERRVLSAGNDHTEMFAIFKSLVERSGAKKGDALIWAGCEGACYAMATFFSYYLLDLELNLYFATDGDLKRLWRLERVDGVGAVATKKVEPLKAKAVILMSGLMNVPFENVLTLVRNGLVDDGVVIGETVVPGLFESMGWHEQIPIQYLFEFSMQGPTALEIVEIK